jgi:hypothetical protein
MQTKSKFNILLFSALAIFSITSHAYNPKRVTFDMDYKAVPDDASNIVVAFIYDSSEGYNPGVIMYKNDQYGHQLKPFPIKTDSKYISITRAEVEYDRMLHTKYRVDVSCNNIPVLNGDSNQDVYFKLDIENRILSCATS